MWQSFTVLNFSVTQELAKQMQQKDIEIAMLKTELKKQEHGLEILKASVAQLQKIMESKNTISSD